MLKGTKTPKKRCDENNKIITSNMISLRFYEENAHSYLRIPEYNHTLNYH